jgi:hypothetical protein
MSLLTRAVSSLAALAFVATAALPVAATTVAPALAGTHSAAATASAPGAHPDDERTPPCLPPDCYYA